MIFIDRKFRLPRLWSNKEIRKVGFLFKGDIINVSGWKDQDKEGGHYCDYFTQKKSYTISNFGGYRGFQGTGGEVFIDLEKDIPADLIEKFDLVFNHTTLEHVYEIRKAFSNLCHLSRDCVMVVVPFIQSQHESDDFKDFWRFTPTLIKQLFEENGFEMIFAKANSNIHAGIYVMAIGTKNPEKWKGIFPPIFSIVDAGWISAASLKEIFKKIFFTRYK